MKFALLGDDVAAVPLIEAALATGQRFVRAALADRLLATHTSVATIPKCSWEDLLIDNNDFSGNLTGKWLLQGTYQAGANYP